MPARSADDSVLIIGGGPAGLEAALSLGRRGYRVTLAESDAVMGGRVTSEAALPGLSAWGRVRDYRLGQLAKLGSVSLYPSSRMETDDILGFGADRVVIATGAQWRRELVGRGGRIGAAQIGPVLTPDDIMGGLVPTGRILVHDIEGGYMGGLIAEKLRLSGAEVTLSSPNLSHSGFLRLTLEQDRVLRRLIALGVTLTASRDLAGFEPGSAHLTSTLGAADLEIRADHLVLVADRVPRDSLARDLMLCPDRVQAAGILSVTTSAIVLRRA
jgi:dimethylamine/trimethylamine dehydrogenase